MLYINAKAPRDIVIKEAELSCDSHGVGIRTHGASPRLALYGLPIVKISNLSNFLLVPV